MTMQIAFDAKRLYNNTTGLGNYSRTVVDGLLNQCADLCCWLYTPRVGTAAVAGEWLQHERCHTVTAPAPWPGSAWRTWGQAPDLRRRGIRLFHGLSNELPTGLRRHGVRSVVTIHDVAFRTYPDMYHWHDRPIYDRKWRYACTHADLVVCISESTRRDVLRFYDVPAERTQVIYQPVAPAFYEMKNEESGMKNEELRMKNDGNSHSSFSSEASILHSSFSSEASILHSSFSSEASILHSPFMLYVGSINSRKNLLGIVRAIELLPTDLRLPLVVVGGGRGSYRREVADYVSSHSLEPWVVFPDRRIDDAELRSLYRQAQLLVYPSFYEGMGLPVIEALLSRCPVVTSNLSSLPEAAGPHSVQVDPYDVGSIAEGIERVLTDDALRATMISEGEAYARRTFAPERLTQQLLQAYRSLLD